MEIVKMHNKLKCDFPGCRHLSEVSICDEVDINKRLNLCEDCLTKIYESIAKTITPKSVNAPFKNQKKLR